MKALAVKRKKKNKTTSSARATGGTRLEELLVLKLGESEKPVKQNERPYTKRVQYARDHGQKSNY